MATASETTADTDAPEQTLTVNGERLVSRARTLADLLVEQGFTDGRFATALNSAFVPQAHRTTVQLAEGDTVEILTARQGG